jgi:hypothetical protein
MRKHRVYVLASLVLCKSVIVNAQIECETMWGGGSSSGVVVIPADRINDGYCDCVNGADETTTEACAGLSAWAGLDISWNDPKTTT